MSRRLSVGFRIFAYSLYPPECFEFFFSLCLQTGAVKHEGTVCLWCVLSALDQHENGGKLSAERRARKTDPFASNADLVLESGVVF